MTVNSSQDLGKKGGKIRFSIDDHRFREPYFGVTTFEFGEDPNGAIMVVQVVPPDAEFAPHYHDTDYCTIVMKGSLKVGSRWYETGDCRVQDAQSVYGPVWSGPDGCTVISFYGDRTALMDQFAKEEHKRRFDELIPIAAEKCIAAGIGVGAVPPAPADEDESGPATP
jgi:hypothetical protein